MKMRLPLIVATAMLIGFIAIAAVRAAGAPDLPPGVKANDWIQLNDSLGFAIQRESGPNLYVLQGRFMVKRRGIWWQISPVGETGVLPAVMSADAQLPH